MKEKVKAEGRLERKTKYICYQPSIIMAIKSRLNSIKTNGVDNCRAIVEIYETLDKVGMETEIVE